MRCLESIHGSARYTKIVGPLADALAVEISGGEGNGAVDGLIDADRKLAADACEEADSSIWRPRLSALSMHASGPPLAYTGVCRRPNAISLRDELEPTHP